MDAEAQTSGTRTLRQVDIGFSILASAALIYYVFDLMVDFTTKEIWKRQARQWWERKFPCCEDCAEKKRQEAFLIWEAIRTVEDLP